MAKIQRMYKMENECPVCSNIMTIKEVHEIYDPKIDDLLCRKHSNELIVLLEKEQYDRRSEDEADVFSSHSKIRRENV